MLASLFAPAPRPGDKVALICPSGPVDDRASLARGIARLESWGLKPEVLPNALQRLDYPAGSALAGTDEQRAADLQRAISEPAYRAIFCIRGGYGLTRILEHIDFAPLRKAPKPIVGYSDVTALLAAAHAETGLVSLHGPGVATPTSHDAGATNWALQRALLMEPKTPPALMSATPAHALRPGLAEGPLVGGNLTLVCALIGTKWQIDTEGKILFLEDVNEAPYRVDRMLTQLLQSGALRKAKGVVFGDFHLEDTPLASETPQIVRVLADRTRALGIPCAHGFPFGHRPSSWTLPVGARARLDARDLGKPATLTLLESAVRGS